MKRANPELFFKDARLPFVEARYAEDSRRLFKPHMHRTFSVGAVHRGALHYQIEGRDFTLHPGTLALINPETIHSCNPTSHQARSYSMLYLHIDWCMQIQQTRGPVEHFIPVHEIMLKNQSLYAEYCAIIHLLLHRPPDLLKLEESLAQLFGKIFSATCPIIRSQQSVSMADVNLLKHILSQNLDREITLAGIAKELASNPYTLLRRFKRETGLTPHAYRLNCRIETARTYLQQGTDIGDTAFLCGFCDQSHFHRTFKAMTTVTPREYQQGIQHTDNTAE
ncbi:helix-turn-helix transcriptional regulator [Desulfogranum japonicum]|uniref:helix-turn-helix transcriptional regulator n=1 Tax=Desulfogranum japonicum TaxID=231447 RepID=UPI000429B0E9|nr:AraC family transcriptional regulator [Desulfogranum japonicum]